MNVRTAQQAALVQLPSRPFQAARCAAGRLAVRASASDSTPAQPSHGGNLDRRQFFSLSAAAACTAISLGTPPIASAEPEANSITGTREPLTLAQPTQTEGFLSVEDSTLAYKFAYPVQSASGRKFPIIFSRRPERYSSAAPLSPDARQRICCSLVSLADSITYTVTVGPEAGVLKGVDPDEWRPKDVAETVLIDRSTSRLTNGQRVALNDVEKIDTEQRDGKTYWVYEHLSQGSPTNQDSSAETFRHALAATTMRRASDGTPFLFTLNLSCPEELWEDMQPQFQRAIDSFRLVEPNKDYVPPDQEPWRFF